MHLFQKDKFCIIATISAQTCNPCKVPLRKHCSKYLPVWFQDVSGDRTFLLPITCAIRIFKGWKKNPPGFKKNPNFEGPVMCGKIKKKEQSLLDSLNQGGHISMLSSIVLSRE